MFWEENVEGNYRNWLQKFELYYLVASEKNYQGKIKSALFLHMAREKAIEVYNALTFTDTEKGKSQKYVQGKQNIAHKRHQEHNDTAGR